MENSMYCPVCEQTACCSFASVGGRDYWRCGHCQATFLHPAMLPSANLELAQYRSHLRFRYLHRSGRVFPSAFAGVPTSRRTAQAGRLAGSDDLFPERRHAFCGLALSARSHPRGVLPRSDAAPSGRASRLALRDSLPECGTNAQGKRLNDGHRAVRATSGRVSCNATGRKISETPDSSRSRRWSRRRATPRVHCRLFP